MVDPNQLSAPIASRELDKIAIEGLKNFRVTGDCRVAPVSRDSVELPAQRQPEESTSPDSYRMTF